MFELAWSNLMHHKLRTALSALAVAIGIALMIVSKGLSNGSIAEVGQRMQSVDAELVVLPAQENVIFSGGAVFPGVFERFIAKQADEIGPLAAAVVPVFFGQVRMGGQQQRLFGVDPAQMKLFLAARRTVQGRVFDRAFHFAEQVKAGAILQTLANESATSAPTSSVADGPDPLADGLELVIDDRLQRVGDRGKPYELGQVIRVMGKEFRIVGVVEAGVAGRVFAPIQTLRQMLNGGEPWSSMFFVKLRPNVDVSTAADKLAAALGTDARVELKAEYSRLLRESFSQVNLYMNASSGLALVVCFLFILLTMYTLVIERTREIGILKSLGVTRFGLLQLSITEALLISVAGVALGLALSFAARFALGRFMPLLTIDLAPSLLAAAALIGVLGGVLSALYPGYRAARLEPATALGYE